MRRRDIFSSYLSSTWGSTSNVSSKLNEPPDDIRKLNGSVWEFFQPPRDGDGVPKVEVIFFHGAQLSNDAQSFWKTWLSRDETVVWPTAWLAQKFPGARILFISYDSAIRQCPASSGQMDMYQIMENLISDVIWSKTCKAGQKCPVIFVGHCFGGIIIKQFLIKCSGLIGVEHGENSSVREVKLFLQHCKAIFYYSTPNGGSRLMDGLVYTDKVHQSMVDFLKILSPDTARINMEFTRLRHNSNLKWECRGIGETLETNLRGFKKTMVVPQASARQDVDRIYWAHDADHFNVTRAENDFSCNIFTMLRDLIDDYYNKSPSSIPIALPMPNDECYGIGKLSLDVQETITSLLPFPPDNKYVPIISSFDAVVDALENEHGCAVVTIYGEAGLGKTSLVKYIALRYSAHHGHSLLRSRETSSLAMFPDGVFFLPCGLDGISKQRIKHLQHELLQILGCHSDALPVDSPEESDGDSISIQTLKRRLGLKFRNLKALIILDDVWDRPILQELIVNLDEARSVKYLLTSQIIDIWPDAIKIQLERPILEEAEEILLNYTKESSTETSFPENIKEVAGKILNQAEGIPFVIATLGAQLRQAGEDITDVHVWRSTLMNSTKCLNRRTSFKSTDGTMFQGTYWSALRRSLDVLYEKEKQLFFLMCLCKGPFVPQHILQFFCNILLSCDHMLFVQCKAKLKRRHLVLEENKSFLSISPLKKNLVVEYMQDNLESVVQSLVEIGPHTPPNVPGIISQKAITVLLCLHLDAEFGEPLALQINVPFDTLGEAMRRTIEPITDLLVTEIISSGNWTGLIHKSAVQVFLDFTCKSVVDDDHISQLLGLQLLGCANAVMNTLQFLQNVTLLEGSFWQRNIISRVRQSLLKILQDNTHLHFHGQAGKILGTIHTRNLQTQDSVADTSGMLHQMVQCLSQDQNPDLQYRAINLISAAAYFSIDNILFKILGFAEMLSALLHKLVNLVKSEDRNQNSALAEVAVTAIANLAATEDFTIKEKIACFPNLLESLGLSLSKIQNPTLQGYATLALRNLAMANTSIKEKIVHFPELLESLVKSIDQEENYGLAEQAARVIVSLANTTDLRIRFRICSFPTLLQSLGVSLSKDQNPPLQMNAVRALGNLSLGLPDELREEILDVFGVLDSLVKSIDQDHNSDLAAIAARVIDELADLRDPTSIRKLAYFPTLLQSLGVSLSKDQNPSLQMYAATALISLADGDQPVKEKILDVSGLLDNLVKIMDQDHNPDLAQSAGRLIAILASDLDPSINHKLANFPNLLQSFRVSLSKNQNPDLQRWAKWALFTLANEE